MSIRASAWAWTVRADTPAEKLVLLALADFADEIGLCWPSVETLTEKAGLSERTVRNALRSLEAQGVIATAPSRGRGHSSRYMLRINATEEKGQDLPPNEPEKGQELPGFSPEKGQDLPVLAPGKGAGFAPIAGEKGQSTTQKGQSTTKKGQDLPPNHQEPSRTVREKRIAPAPLPEWLPVDAWADWCRHKGRKWGEGVGPARAIASLDRYRADGHDPRDVIDHSLASGYAGLFPPNQRAAQPKQPTSKPRPWWLEEMIHERT